VRLQASTYSLAEFMLAKPLTLEPSAPKLGETDKDVRVGVSLKLFY